MFPLPPFRPNGRRAALALTAAASLLLAAQAQAEPFFGDNQSRFGGSSHAFYPTTRTTRVYTETAFYQPNIAPQVSRPEADDQEVVPEIENRGAQPTVSGNRAVIRHGVAYAPSNAPDAVKRAIWAVNSIRKTPYKWGGGHGSFSDSGYDCSGSVSFALHHAGVLGTPMPSKEFRSYGERGRGRWVTVYARNGHTFAIIAGLRLDTTDLYRGGNVGPRWYPVGRETWGFEARHPVGL